MVRFMINCLLHKIMSLRIATVAQPNTLDCENWTRLTFKLT